MNERIEEKQVERKEKDRKKENAFSHSVTDIFIRVFTFHALNSALNLFCNLVINFRFYPTVKPLVGDSSLLY
jgi:hypothetical protein